ncbi:MAG: TIGR04283 family arsenosugar biosynthesis glycosyltransferase [Chthoniobacteraceae bacterium]
MIAVIIPTHDEAGNLPATLQSIAENSTRHEVLIVDAASGDDTSHLARENGALVLDATRRHRAVQMNAGAMQARGETLLFLHADTRLAPTALNQIEVALREPGVIGGGFARRYDSRSRFLRATCLLAEARSRLSGWFLGDQAIFVRREKFTVLGGFREFDLFEDLDFSRRMRREGGVVTLRPPVVSSARRFTLRGPLRTTLSDFKLTLLYALGRDPNDLAARLRGGAASDQRVPTAAASSDYTYHS